MALPSAQCSRNGSWWLCKNLYLVSARGANWVVADAQGAYSHALVISQSELILIQGHLQSEATAPAARLSGEVHKYLYLPVSRAARLGISRAFPDGSHESITFRLTRSDDV